ncbi:MAG: hypothetical protein Q7O66_05970 [Dehalococcoidia bacterium]|nr:hypothetical protein [Dehalococcoidia bacterium]
MKPGGIADYVVRAAAGQRLSITLRSQFSNAILSVFGLSDEAQLVSRSEYVTNWSGTAPASQDYAVKVITLAGYDLSYSLSIQLLPAEPTPTPAVTASPVPKPTSSPTPVPSSSLPSASDVPILVRGDLRLSERPLADLSPDAARFLQSRAADWGVAVVVPGTMTVYVANPDQKLETASVVKVLIMLTVFDQAKQEHRNVGEDELELMWPMITESDNDSATFLWNLIGGGARIKTYLYGIGILDIDPYMGPFYGTTVASARAVATILARTAFGDLLEGTDRKDAVQMLLEVVRSQRWGVPSGAETGSGHRDRVGLKNGWYPEERGWRVNSTGFFVSPSANQPAYALAVMTNRQSEFRYGVDTIEGVASRIHSALHP